MLRREVNDVGNPKFSWGPKKGTALLKKTIQLYESFKYEGVEYFLYDSVYMWREDAPELYIGKLVKIWETERHKKKVKVVWYFRPNDIAHWLGGNGSEQNEIFLASGEGEGLFNHNPVEAIAGKCNVVCTSKDRRNPRASTEDIEMADFVFSRTFNVANCKISDTFPDLISGIRVERFFNQRKEISVALTDVRPVKKRKFDPISVDSKEDVTLPPKARAVVGKPSAMKNETQMEQVAINEKDKCINDKTKTMESKQRPEVDSSNWFRQQTWEEKLMNADKMGSLVLLENLDPSITTSQVEEFVRRAFKKKVIGAKMIPTSNYSSPHYGKALVMFKSKDEADFAISELNNKCLLLEDGRVVVGRRPSLKEPGNKSKFFGHLKLLQPLPETQNAVSTSHYSQANTIEFDMAMEWLALQQKSNKWWSDLYKKQGIEIAGLKSQVKLIRTLGNQEKGNRKKVNKLHEIS